MQCKELLMFSGRSADIETIKERMRKERDFESCDSLIRRSGGGDKGKIKGCDSQVAS